MIGSDGDRTRIDARLQQIPSRDREDVERL
ncbi:hypothetical protein ACVJGD_003248 [Bradyrhizobium sp. USDA 10063]